ncbi:hypothetical protein EV192_105290 [Actinocrispum wychmicini]|uniref:Uncharacterized protein n=1 Tax=Actinocrispum wychmicini TaxID=1213861 RepID=A0A4R2JVN6_9PSEU|nr:hypothetical protein EV192_105290 [Actinocrispum wychmicini]
MLPLGPTAGPGSRPTPAPQALICRPVRPPGCRVPRCGPGRGPRRRGRSTTGGAAGACPRPHHTPNTGGWREPSVDPAEGAPVPDGLVRQHRCELRPPGVVHGLRQPGPAETHHTMARTSTSGVVRRPSRGRGLGFRRRELGCPCCRRRCGPATRRARREPGTFRGDAWWCLGGAWVVRTGGHCSSSPLILTAEWRPGDDATANLERLTNGPHTGEIRTHRVPACLCRAAMTGGPGRPRSAGLVSGGCDLPPGMPS